MKAKTEKKMYLVLNFIDISSNGSQQLLPSHTQSLQRKNKKQILIFL